MLKKAMIVAALVAVVPTAALAQDEPPPGDGAGGGTGAPAGGDAGAAASGAMAETGTGPAVFKHGTMGLSFAVPTGGGQNMNLAWFADNKTAYDLLFGLHYAHTPDTTAGNPPVTVPGGDIFGATVGFGLRMYKHHSARIHTFVEPFAVVSSTDFSNFADTLSIGIGGQMGAECMFTDWFSVSGAIGLSLDFSQKFKQINLDTSTSGLFANFYWD